MNQQENQVTIKKKSPLQAHQKNQKRKEKAKTPSPVTITQAQLLPSPLP